MRIHAAYANRRQAVTLIINNDDVARILTMADTLEVLEEAYADLATRDAVCRPRIDIQIPTEKSGVIYQWGTMEGGSTRGYFAIRMKSDIMYEREYSGVRVHERYCVKPGLYCGLIFLTSIRNGEPLALINDGVLQHMRVGADGGIGVKYMSREDSHVVGMLGAGGMARSHMDAFMLVRDIKRVQVFSPTPANRERYADEIRQKHGVEVVVCDNPRDVYRGADIIAGCTNSSVPVIRGEWLEPGQHVLNVGGGTGMPDADVRDRIDVYFRFGNAPAPEGLPEMQLADEWITYTARPDIDFKLKKKPPGHRAHGVAMPDRVVYLGELKNGTKAGRGSRDQITYSERGNLQGNQFHAVAGRVYELAKNRGLGREIPTEWLLQDIQN
jgi:ornithine cyclodeaminase/alanine dehydrogenase-like protein (mu-crystallin family)